jgi:hypothetical protein
VSLFRTSIDHRNGVSIPAFFDQGNGVSVPALHGEPEAACGVPGRSPLLYDRQGADSLQVSPFVLRTVRIRIRLLTLMPDPDRVFSSM